MAANITCISCTGFDATGCEGRKGAVLTKGYGLVGNPVGTGIGGMGYARGGCATLNVCCAGGV